MALIGPDQARQRARVEAVGVQQGRRLEFRGCRHSAVADAVESGDKRFQAGDLARDVTDESKKAFVLILLTSSAGGTSTESRVASEAWQQLARTFGVPVRQLRQDLNLIFVCGLPGHTPGDLIEVWFGPDDTVSVTNADTISRPLRLTTDEALALLVALRTLADVPAAEGGAP